MKINLQHKAVGEYYRTLKEVQQQGGTNEEALRRAFQGLLVTFGREQGWTLMEEQRLANGSKPDGTLIDRNTLQRGFWEAKDAKDDLETEIKKKIARGYPLTNTIFEDTRRAVLYQQGRRVDSFDLTQPKWLADLLEQFFGYSEPAIAQFEQAVEEFKGRIPDLARGLLKLITEERAGKNKAFQRAFEEFHTLCRGALNPQISVAAIDEMLVQHLLTERLFRTIFNNPDFIHRNVIAAEIEKVIDALTSHAFNRNDFLKGLDRFYLAIEEAARTISDWTEKQRFLNTVYERFFQGFSVKQADTYGIVYTPQEIVDFMVASVDEVLRREFGKDLSSPGVQILDPCTGTGNFIVNILRRVSLGALQQKYTQDLFANEIMLLPYYIASLNIEHAYYEKAGHYLPFDGICFVDTLDMVLENRPQSLWLSEANTDRISRENMAEITVIIGNPPYNAWQENENDNNKNRRYELIDKHIRETYADASKATLKAQLYDPYVKFFRWATDRLGKRDGIVCFVSNNSFVDQISFDGMRRHLQDDFTQIYHLDLHGNVRKNPKLSGTKHNVFGIQVGVGITIAVRNSHNPTRCLRYFRVPEDWRKTTKLAFLAEKQSIAGIDWQELQPDEKHTWLTEGMRSEFAGFLSMGTKEAKAVSTAAPSTIFKTYCGGVKTGRDSLAYDFEQQTLATRIQQAIEDYNAEVSRWVRAKRPKDIDSFVSYDKVKWSVQLKNKLEYERYGQFEPSSIRSSMYRPFCKKFLYYSRLLNDAYGLFGEFFPTAASEAENIVIVVSDHGYRSPFSTLVTNFIPDLHLLASTDMFQCFPFYTYNEDGSGRRENITEWALGQFRAQYGPEVGKWDIFHYVYALLHHPQYRQRYAENLKRELPRIPLAPDGEAFARLVSAGARLKALHLGYEQAAPYPLRAVEHPKASADELYRVTKMRLSPDKTALVVNEALTLAGIPAEVYQYRLGNRSALEWVIDQYQVSTDPRSGISSDPNREDEPEYISQLARRVVTVSLATVEIVNGLPALPEGEEAPQPLP